MITIRTNLGDIEVELLQNKAPETVQNFLQYAKDGHYTGTIFHRVIDGFMIQGGGYTADFKEKKTRSPVRNEADNRVSNKRGTLAMARTSDIHSATGQFFINVADNDFLNYRNPTPSGFGYCVFGEVTKGMDIVDKIKKVKTGSEKGHQDVPLQSIKILEVLVH
ncbi:MAG: peptidyl-prolyl cis-trans isomerase [Chlamydiales bacterium]|nr:peptidyl-prolyl cis-trans isomerase [Chlamydiales bacterium]